MLLSFFMTQKTKMVTQKRQASRRSNVYISLTSGLNTCFMYYVSLLDSIPCKLHTLYIFKLWTSSHPNVHIFDQQYWLTLIFLHILYSCCMYAAMFIIIAMHQTPEQNPWTFSTQYYSSWKTRIQSGWQKLQVFTYTEIKLSFSTFMVSIF